jgi:hypothetical protein
MQLQHHVVSKRFALTLLTTALCACGGGADLNQQDATSMAPPPSATSTTAPAINVPIEFSDTRNSFVIMPTATGFEVRKKFGPGSPVAVSRQAILKFSDVTVRLGIGEQSKTIPADDLRTLIELYIAFFNRVPDAEGLGYWIGEVKAGMTIDQLASNFYGAAVQRPNLTGYSATMSNADFVKIIYKNVLGRSGDKAPPQDDVNYWAGELDSGRSTKGALVKSMLDSAHSFVGHAEWGWVPQLLDNKIAVGKYFAVEHGLGYIDPNDSISKGMDIAGKVSATSTEAARTLMNVSDTSFNLLGTSASGSGVGDSRNCLNPDLYRQGVSHYTEMTSDIRSTGTSERFAVTYKANGNVNFKGQSAQEIVADTLLLSGQSAGVVSQVKTYVAIGSNEVVTYGSILSVKLNNTVNYEVTNTMTPPERMPYALVINQPYRQTTSVKMEITGNTMSFPETTSTETTTFLGVESVSVPAGTFNACKLQSIGTSNGFDTYSYAWYVAEGDLRGMVAKVDSGDSVTVATKMSVNR